MEVTYGLLNALPKDTLGEIVTVIFDILLLDNAF